MWTDETRIKNPISGGSVLRCPVGVTGALPALPNPRRGEVSDLRVVRGLVPANKDPRLTWLRQPRGIRVGREGWIGLRCVSTDRVQVQTIQVRQSTESLVELFLAHPALGHQAHLLVQHQARTNFQALALVADAPMIEWCCMKSCRSSPR